MRGRFLRKLGIGLLFGAALMASVSAFAANKPITIAEQGSFAAGGTYIQHEGEFDRARFLNPEGQKAYGDHAYVFYQKPVKAKKLPLVFQHGGAQTKRTWESTPDGREGFQNIFLRKGYSVYLLDQPRMGEAGLATEADDGSNPWAFNPMYADKTLYELSRIGLFEGDTPVPFANSPLPQDADSYDQFQRSWSTYEGKLDNDLNAEALAVVLEKTGPAIVVTHSMGGTIGWRVASRSQNVKAIVAFEPGGTEFLFPEGEVPEAQQATFAPLTAAAKAVPLADFLKLTEIPIVLFYGDNIYQSKTDVGPDKWASELDMATKFVDAVNRHGGRAELVKLPDIGIKGNTHFLMADLNNEEVAEQMAKWLKDKGLDK